MLAFDLPAAAGAAAPAASPPLPYTVHVLGTLGGSYAVSVGVNNSGLVAGSSQTASGAMHAFTWTRDGGTVDLGDLGSGSATAAAVSDAGHVVGTSADGSGSQRAFLWTARTGMVALGLPPGFSSSYAAAVASSGLVGGDAVDATGDAPMVWRPGLGPLKVGLGGSGAVLDVSDAAAVGYSRRPGSTSDRAFLWTQASGSVDLGALGGAAGTAVAVAVSANGQVVGASADPTWPRAVSHAVSWTAGRTIDLGVLPGAEWSSALAVAESGQVVGFSGRGGITPHAFSWTASGGMVDLGVLDGDVYSRATAVNNRGLVVGISTDWDTPKPFVWTAGDGSRALPLPIGAMSGFAVAVNDDGVIAGQALFADQGHASAVVWTPASDFDLAAPELESLRLMVTTLPLPPTAARTFGLEVRAAQEAAAHGLARPALVALTLFRADLQRLPAAVLDATQRAAVEAQIDRIELLLGG